MRASVACKEARDEILDWRIVEDFPKLAMIMVLGNDNIPGITNDVDHSRITGIEAVMALDDSGLAHPVEVSLCGAFGIRDQAMDIRESSRLLWVDQIGEKKTGPGIARFRERNQKNIVRKNQQAATRPVQPEPTLYSGNQVLNHLWLPPFAPGF
jgi:hypothetical protein